MPNAMDYKGGRKRFFVWGNPGVGKTTLIKSLQGKKFVYMFDPAGVEALAGADIEYESFVPVNLDIDVVSMQKDKRDNITKRVTDHDIYLEFERHWMKALKDNYFDQFDWVCFDSYTMLMEIVMDRILYLNGRPGKPPEQIDWTSQMSVIFRITRAANALPCSVLFTAHAEAHQDELLKTITFQPYLTGKLKLRVPALFSDVFPMTAEADNKGLSVKCRTVPAKRFVTARTSLIGLDPVEDITLDYSKPLEGQGFAAMLRKGGYEPALKGV